MKLSDIQPGLLAEANIGTKWSGAAWYPCRVVSRVNDLAPDFVVLVRGVGRRVVSARALRAVVAS